MIASRLGLALLLCGAPALAAGGYGQVVFANSGAPGAQADFLDGLALLHDFEYSAAEGAFQRAQAVDPNFAMAYWGEAMTFNHPIWMQQDREAALAALRRLAPTPAERRALAKSEREKDYFDAVEILYGEGTKESRDFRYAEAMAKLSARYPDDVDAVALRGLAILGTAHAGRDVATYMRAAALLEEAWPENSGHPGLAHYLIHSYDDPAHAPLGLRAARLYSRIAPEAGHAQHMTSHIFLALGMWPETVAANVAAIAAVNRVRAAAGKRQVGCGHYPTWLGYAHLQLGQFDAARGALALCKSAVESEAAPESPGHSMDPDDSLSGAFANMRLRYLLDSGDWGGEIADWSAPRAAGPGARLDFAFARTLREIHLGNDETAVRALNELEAAGREVAEIEARRADADPSYRVRPAILELEARALLDERNGDLANAELRLREAIVLEEQLPIAFGPPTIDKPTYELLGEYLLRRGRMAEASAAFTKALALAPGRRLSETGLQSAAAGSPSLASP